MITLPQKLKKKHIFSHLKKMDDWKTKYYVSFWDGFFYLRAFHLKGERLSLHLGGSFFFAVHDEANHNSLERLSVCIEKR